MASGDEDQSARFLYGEQAPTDGRQPQFLEKLEDLEGDGTEDPGDGAALDEDIAAEARQALDAKGEVELVVRLELLLSGCR